MEVANLPVTRPQAWSQVGWQLPSRVKHNSPKQGVVYYYSTTRAYFLLLEVSRMCIKSINGIKNMAILFVYYQCGVQCACAVSMEILPNSTVHMCTRSVFSKNKHNKSFYCRIIVSWLIFKGK